MMATLNSATTNSAEKTHRKDPVRWAVQGVLAIYLLPVLAVVLVLGGMILAVQGICRVGGMARHRTLARAA